MTIWIRRWFVLPALFVGAASAGATACEAGNDSSASPPTGQDGGGGNDGSAESSPSGGIVNVQILAFNDFHGNLRPPSPSNSVVLAKAGDSAITDAGTPVATDAGTADAGGVNYAVHAGGVSYLAAHIKALRAKNPNTLVVSAGDLTGASPLI